MTERSKASNAIGVTSLLGKGMTIEVKTAEPPDERASRLKREEAEAAHDIRSREAKEGHERRIVLLLHLFVMGLIGVALVACVYIAVAKDPKTDLPRTALGIMATIVAAGFAYFSGKASK